MGALRGRVTPATLIGLVVSVVLASPVSAVSSRTGASARHRCRLSLGRQKGGSECRRFSLLLSGGARGG
jgi:hypothetical protein